MPQMNNRAYSVLEIKSLDEDKRELTGTATTPAPDRVGDIVEPLGAKFASELPLLWQHQHDKPVGTVKFDKPTKNGITFKATLPVIPEDGPLKQMVDMAWQAVKAKLVRGVSIGFRPIEYSFIDGGGVRFSETEIYELSLVTIPAQSQATIQTIKSIDTQLRAAHGKEKRGVVFLDPPPGDSGTKDQPAKSRFFYARNPEGMDMKTIAEQIAAFEQTLQTKTAKRLEIQTKAADEGRTKDSAERTEFEELDRDIEEIKKELVDLRKMQADVEAQAKAVEQPKGSPVGARAPVQAKNTQKLEPGIPLARYARCLLLAEGNKMHAAQIAKNQYAEMDWMVNLLDAEVAGNDKAKHFLMNTKTAVAGGNTTDATWAAPLVQYQQYGLDFIEYLRPQMIIGKFGMDGVPGLHRIPFNVTVSGQTSGGTAGWVGEAAPKPVTKFDYANVNLRWAKIAGITVCSEELARMSTPGAERLLRDQMAKVVIARADYDFIDPDKAAVSNVSPASIINGVAPVSSSGGNSAAEVRADIRMLFNSWITNNLNPESAVFIMSPGTALALSLMYNDLDSARVFPGISMKGGTLEGIPVIVSQYAASVQDGGSAGSLVILVNADEVYLSEDAGVDIAVSREASIQMNDAPDNPATASTVFTSMFQTNQLAIRSELYINWQKRRAQAAAWLDSVSWGT